MKITAVAPANIALIKYWGMRDASLTLPMNTSISMTLSRCVARTTLEPIEGERDEVWLAANDGLHEAGEAFAEKVRAQLNRLRAQVRTGPAFRVATANSFPIGAGIASSAAGFAALTVAAAAALALPDDAAAWSNLARLSGSGSAARSVFGGFVQWPAYRDRPDAPARQLAPSRHWPLCDLIAIVDARVKETSSREGHRRAVGSPYYPVRQTLLPARLEHVCRALDERDFAALAEAVEEEAIDLHLIAMSARPPIFYWQPATLAVLAEVRRLRADGLHVCATIDAGPNVHVLCEPGHAAAAAAALAALPGVAQLIEDQAGDGPVLVAQHLF
jgi:diphosphomevalonate decarboxylase